jgi:hypothetical protein
MARTIWMLGLASLFMDKSTEIGKPLSAGSATIWAGARA